MSHALVTGATGFIGTRLVRQLTQSGWQVTCLVRPESDRRGLQLYAPRIVVASLMDQQQLRQAVDGVDAVFHLAGMTKAQEWDRLLAANAQAPANMAAACAACASPPRLIFVSSLAAAGPTTPGRAVTEADPPRPVSHYGRSKLAGERAVAEYAAGVPITVVRPPIVLGPDDRTGLDMFRSISRFGVHVLPGYRTARMSVIYVDDLVAALLAAYQHGQRLSPLAPSQGIYFAAAEESPSYAELGRWIGAALGRRWTLTLPVPGNLIRVVAAFNEGVGRWTGKPLYLNWDKSREVLAGSWYCSAERLRQETGFRPPVALRQRLAETVQWYRAQGWLPAAASSGDIAVTRERC